MPIAYRRRDGRFGAIHSHFDVGDTAYCDRAVGIGTIARCAGHDGLLVKKEDMMLTMTEAAGGYLSEVLDQSQAPENSAVRLIVGPEGLTAAVDAQRPGDAIYDHDGRKVLLLDEQASEALAERTLDLQPTPDGKRLGLS